MKTEAKNADVITAKDKFKDKDAILHIDRREEWLINEFKFRKLGSRETLLLHTGEWDMFYERGKFALSVRSLDKKQFIALPLSEKYARRILEGLRGQTFIDEMQTISNNI